MVTLACVHVRLSDWDIYSSWGSPEWKGLRWEGEVGRGQVSKVALHGVPKSKLGCLCRYKHCKACVPIVNKHTTAPPGNAGIVCSASGFDTNTHLAVLVGGSCYGMVCT